MHKFKVGDIIESKFYGKKRRVTGVFNDKDHTYETELIEGQEGLAERMSGDYRWCKDHIEGSYELVERQPQLTFDDYMKKFSNLQNELSILDSRNTILNSRTKMRLEKIETLEESIESLREDIKKENQQHSDNVARKLEIMNEIVELNKQFGGQ